MKYRPVRVLTRTGHHYKDGLDFKFEDEPEETVLRKIEWTPSRSGALALVAIFDPVEMGGCEVSRASHSNLTCIRDPRGVYPSGYS